MKKFGWSEEEKDILNKFTCLALKNKQPLISAFEKTALLTGRKADSVRNFYYKTREENSPSLRFSKEEKEDMLFYILKEVGKGKSVRQCCFDIGGDKKGMLRLQNKFRSVIKNEESLVKNIMQDLKNKGEKVFDPYKSNIYEDRDKTELFDICREFVEENDVKRIERLKGYVLRIKSIIYN